MPESTPKLLRQEQDKIVKRIRKYTDDGDTDLERLMAYQHNGGKTNLLDFSREIAVALYFACFSDSDNEGQVIVKQENMFHRLETSSEVLPRDKTVLLEPHQKLKRAMDQKGVLIHAPDGSLPVAEEETVVIKAEWKQEVLSYLENECDISYGMVFDDIHGDIELQRLENEKRVPDVRSKTSIEGFIRPKDDKEAIAMNFYMRLLYAQAGGIYDELLRNYAGLLIANFTEMLRHNPQDAGLYYNRAFVYQSKSKPDYERAISDYTQAIERNPSLAEAHNNRGNAYRSKPKPDYEKAISDFDRALELNPNSYKAYNNRGVTHSENPNPNYDQALSDFAKALRLNPENAATYNNRGALYMMKPEPDYDKALPEYDIALRFMPDSAEVYNNRAIAHLKKKIPNYEQALLDCDKAIKLDPDDPSAYNSRGLVHQAKPNRDYDEAISDFTLAIERNSDLVAAYVNRGTAYMKKPEPDYVESTIGLSTVY